MPTTLLLRQVRLVFASNDCGPLSIRGAESVRRSQNEKTLDLVAWPRRGPATPAAHSVSLETLRPGSGWLSRWYGSCPTYVVERRHTLIRLSLQRSEVNLGEAGRAMTLMCESLARDLLSICHDTNCWAKRLPCMMRREHYAAF